MHDGPRPLGCLSQAFLSFSVGTISYFHLHAPALLCSLLPLSPYDTNARIFPFKPQALNHRGTDLGLAEVRLDPAIARSSALYVCIFNNDFKHVGRPLDVEQSK